MRGLAGPPGRNRAPRDPKQASPPDGPSPAQNVPSSGLLTARASAAAKRAQRAKRSAEAQVSQHPAFQDAQIPGHSFLRGARAYSPSTSYNAHHALLSACPIILSAPLNAAGHVPLVLLICLHDVALQATHPCVVGVTPSVTPPRWFLVM